MLLWFAAPLVPEDERYVIMAGTRCTSSGAQFNAVADELGALKNNGNIKEFGANFWDNNNVGFWMTFTRPTLPYSAHIARFAEKAQTIA